MNNKMSDQQNETDLETLLKHALPPVRNTELPRDVWPQMLRRLEDAHSVHVPWFDWALAAATLAALLFFPNAIPTLLFHL